MDEGERRPRRGELGPDAREEREEALPGRRAVLECELARERVLRRDARARDPVREAQNPDPAPGEDVVHRGVVDGVGRRAEAREVPQGIQPVDVHEVGEEPLRRREAGRRGLPAAQGRRERRVAARGVHEKPRRERERLAEPLALETPALSLARDGPEAGPVAIRGARGLGLLHEEVVEVGPVPVCVRDGVVGARGDEELVAAVMRAREAPALRVPVEREAALEPAGELRVGAAPRPPRREREEARKLEPGRDLLEEKVRERGRGLADREPRVCSLLEEDDRQARAPRDEREEGAGEAGPDDRDVEVSSQEGKPQEDRGGRRRERRRKRKRKISLKGVHGRAGARCGRRRSMRAPRARPRSRGPRGRGRSRGRPRCASASLFTF